MNKLPSHMNKIGIEDIHPYIFMKLVTLIRYDVFGLIFTFGNHEICILVAFL